MTSDVEVAEAGGDAGEKVLAKSILGTSTGKMLDDRVR